MEDAIQTDNDAFLLQSLACGRQYRNSFEFKSESYD
jgi:hypothetical protein